MNCNCAAVALAAARRALCFRSRIGGASENSSSACLVAVIGILAVIRNRNRIPNKLCALPAKIQRCRRRKWRREKFLYFNGLLLCIGCEANAFTIQFYNSILDWWDGEG